MSDNPLVSVLSQSVQAGSFSESVKHLWSAQHIISSPGATSLLNLKVTTLLNRLLSKYSSQIFLPLARTYLAICRIAEGLQSSFLIKLANDVLVICEEIRGTEISEELHQSIQSLLEKLISLGLDADQLEVVSGLKVRQDYSRFDLGLLEAFQKISKNQLGGAHDLFDVFSSFDRFSDQLSLLTSKVFLISDSLSKTTNIEIIKKAVGFLEHFIFKFNYSVQIGESTEVFTVNLAQKLQVSMIPGLVSVINTIIPYEISVSQQLLLLIQRLWFLFPQESASLFDSTRLVLSAVSAQGSPEFKIKASSFLYEILNSPSVPQSLKSLLEDSEQVQGLMSSEAFAPSSGILESEQVIKLEDLQPVVGMPMSACIPAGSEYTYCVEVQETNSILSWGFATRDYDVNFELKRIDLPSPQSILKLDYVQCHEVPFVQSRLINSPGLYQFTWSNNYSWFTEKMVRFRIVVLSPYHKVNSNEKDIHRVIEVICNDEVPSSAKDLLEVGIVCRGKIVQLHALGQQEEIPDLDVNAIAGFVSRLSGPKHKKVKFGIISKQPKKRNELKNLKSVFMSRDVDALALLNESEIHSETLICIVFEEGIRSSVVHRGKVLIDEEGRTIGDLSRANITEPFEAASVLISLFGPAHVIIAGKEAPSISELLDRAKAAVPAEILKNSLIRGPVGGNEAFQLAASKLHVLSHKFKLGY